MRTLVSVRSIGAVALFLPFCRPSFSKTIEVSPGQSIQTAINNASIGDTISVKAGDFFENIDFKGKNISVIGSGASLTTLHAFQGSCVSFQSGENHGALLSGFTLTGGTGSSPPFGGKFGGAIFIMNSEPTISQNVIESNSAGNGGGIWCGGLDGQPWRPVIVGNHVKNNSATLNGGGIAVSETSIPEIRNNLIESNSVLYGDGGGLWFRITRDGLTFTGNQVLANNAGDHGGGLYTAQPAEPRPPVAMEIAWNLFASNSASGRGATGNSGGGVWLWKTHAWVHHNTIVENSGDGPSATYGGGLVLDYPGIPTIEKNIFAFNSGGGIWCGTGVTPVIRDNLAWQNTGGDGVGTCSTWWQSNGNMVGNPYFCDIVSGDFTVAQNSPAITHPAGPLGAFSNPGCEPVSVTPSTWGSLKTRYR